MKLKITKQKAEWSKIPHTRRVVIVEFPNCSFKWMPTYDQLEEIRRALSEIEQERWNER